MAGAWTLGGGGGGALSFVEAQRRGASTLPRVESTTLGTHLEHW